jgi:outer membrane biosynthesis protein TonB
VVALVAAPVLFSVQFGMTSSTPGYDRSKYHRDSPSFWLMMLAGSLVLHLSQTGAAAAGGSPAAVELIEIDPNAPVAETPRAIAPSETAPDVRNAPALDQSSERTIQNQTQAFAPTPSSRSTPSPEASPSPKPESPRPSPKPSLFPSPTPTSSLPPRRPNRPNNSPAPTRSPAQPTASPSPTQPSPSPTQPSPSPSESPLTSETGLPPVPSPGSGGTQPAGNSFLLTSELIGEVTQPTGARGQSSGRRIKSTIKRPGISETTQYTPADFGSQKELILRVYFGLYNSDGTFTNSKQTVELKVLEDSPALLANPNLDREALRTLADAALKDAQFDIEVDPPPPGVKPAEFSDWEMTLKITLSPQ